jgi:hypothetical protein
MACVVQGVPSNPIFRQTFTPQIVYTNTGKATIPAHTVSRGWGDGQGDGAGAEIDIPELAPGQSYTDTWGTSAVKYADANITALVYGSSGTNPDFSCSATMILPQKAALTYTAACAISMPSSGGVKTLGAASARLPKNPTVVFTSTGTGTVSITNAKATVSTVGCKKQVKTIVNFPAMTIPSKRSITQTLTGAASSGVNINVTATTDSGKLVSCEYNSNGTVR